MSSEGEIKSIADWVTKDGSSGYKAEKGRYHLYVSHGCPFAHRTTIYVALKGLEDVISRDIVSPVNDGVNGWEFNPEKRGCTKDSLHGKKYLKEIYAMSHPNYTGRWTVPVLFDKQTNKIVSNESADIIRMLNTEFNDLSSTKDKAELDLYPSSKHGEIDKMNDWLNNDVLYLPYRAIGAGTQDAYEEVAKKMFESLDKLDKDLSKTRYLLGEEITEADIKLFVMLIRFDVGYYSLTLVNKKMICQYDNLWPYLRDVYQYSSIKATCNFLHMKEIYWSNKNWNPSQLIPVGPHLDYDEPHYRSNTADNAQWQ